MGSDPPRNWPACTKCGGPNKRGGRKRLCADCLPGSPQALNVERARARLAECPPGRRWCSACDLYQPPEAFNSAENLCVLCQTAKNRGNHLRRLGLSAEQYERLLKAQGGGCAICGSQPKKQLLHVDHDHETGIIRGLLCLWCNHKLLGGARESTIILQRAIDYLTKPPAIKAIGPVIMPPQAKKARRSLTEAKRRVA